jgi:hypothetical protein
MLKELVDNASENNDVKRVLADGAYTIPRQIFNIFMMTVLKQLSR